MSCKKKEQSSSTSTPRRDLTSLSIKDIAQAVANYLVNTLSPSVSGQSVCDRDDCNLVYRTSHWKCSVSPSISDQYVCDRDNCNQVVHRTSHRKGSVGSSVSNQHISIRDDGNLGIHRSSHHQSPGSSGTHPPSRKQSQTCSLLCAEVSGVIDRIQNCRVAIGALIQDTERMLSAASGLLDDCVCDNKSDQTKKKHKEVKKVDSWCRKILGKKGNDRDTCCVPSGLDNCVCDEAETKKRKSTKAKATASKESCQKICRNKICRNKSSHKVTASDCACNEKKKKQNKKIVAVDSKTCCKNKSSHKDSCSVCMAPKDLDDWFCENDMKKQQMELKKTSSSKIERKASDINTHFLPPIVVDDCAFEKEMRKRNKKLTKADTRNCCQKIFGKKKDQNTCCVPPINPDKCACAADMKKRNNKMRKTDSQDCCCKEMEKKGSDKDSCCIPPVIADDCGCDAEMSKTFQKMVRKKSSVRDTCCVPIAPKDLDDCICEGDQEKQNNKIIFKTESKHSCQKVFEKKTSDKDPVVFDDWTCEGAENKMQSAKKYNLASAAMTCGIPSCPENSNCTCRFPPAYARQYSDCTGQSSGSCQCDKNT